jgi:hypothetical protein
MDRDGIVYGGPDAVLTQEGAQRITRLHSNDVLMIDMRRSRRTLRKSDSLMAGQRAVVRRRHLGAMAIVRVEMLQLHAQDGSLQFIKTAVNPG